MRRITALTSARPAQLNKSEPSDSVLNNNQLALSRPGGARVAAVGVFAAVGLSLAACSSGGDEVASDNQEGNAEQTATDTAAPQDNGAEEDRDNVFSVKKGDCLQLGDSIDGDVKDVEKRNCTEEHDAEVYAEMEMTDATFPSPEASQNQAQKYCAAEFEPFIGKKGNESALRVHYLYPTQASWEQKEDRSIQCIVADPAGGVIGTLKGSER